MPHSVPMPSTRGVAAGGGETGRVAVRVVVMDQPEIESGPGRKLELLERRKIGVVGAPLPAPADERTGSGA